MSIVPFSLVVRFIWTEIEMMSFPCVLQLINLRGTGWSFFLFADSQSIWATPHWHRVANNAQNRWKFSAQSVHKTMTNSSFIRYDSTMCNTYIYVVSLRRRCGIHSVCLPAACYFSVSNYIVWHFHRNTTTHPAHLLSVSLCLFVLSWVFVVWRRSSVWIKIELYVCVCVTGVRSWFYYECGAHRKSHIITISCMSVCLYYNMNICVQIRNNNLS